jgi:Protein of unknown function (DUF2911)
VTRAVCLLMFTVVMTISVMAQNAAQPAAAESDTVCTFADGQQISVRYPQVAVGKDDLPRGKAWSPSDQGIYLFSQTELQFGGKAVPPGAYSLYVIPGSDNWSVAVNRGVQKGQSYDESKDVARINAPLEKLSSDAGHLNLYFGHIAPKTCNLRIDYGKQRAVAAFTEK